MQRFLLSIKSLLLDEKTVSVKLRVLNFILGFAVICGFWVAGQATRTPDKEAYANIMKIAYLPIWLTSSNANNYCADQCDDIGDLCYECMYDPDNTENTYNVDCDCAEDCGCATPTPTPTPGLCPNPTKTVDLTFARHSDVTSFSCTVLDGWLQYGFEKLRPDDDLNNLDGGYDDVKCCFKLNINYNGSISIFGIDKPELFIVNTIDEFNEIRDYGYDCNFVGGFNSPDFEDSLGAAYLNSSKYAVDYYSGSLKKKIIYHEYGHTKGLQDLTYILFQHNLMYNTSIYWVTGDSQCEQL
ncbi:hypothetical protein GF373_09490 [bacterium]|nr:hypothetical protein [bacterium]